MLLDIAAQTVGTNKKFPFRDKLCKCLIPYYPHTQNSDFQIFGSFKNLKSINFANRRNFFFEKQRISGWPIQSFLLTKALKSCQVLLFNKKKYIAIFPLLDMIWKENICNSITFHFWYEFHILVSLFQAIFSHPPMSP